MVPITADPTRGVMGSRLHSPYREGLVNATDQYEQCPISQRPGTRRGHTGFIGCVKHTQGLTWRETWCVSHAPHTSHFDPDRYSTRSRSSERERCLMRSSGMAEAPRFCSSMSALGMVSDFPSAVIRRRLLPSSSL